jgi:hypothetical protein
MSVEDKLLGSGEKVKESEVLSDFIQHDKKNVGSAEF